MPFPASPSQLVCAPALPRSVEAGRCPGCTSVSTERLWEPLQRGMYPLGLFRSAKAFLVLLQSSLCCQEGRGEGSSRFIQSDREGRAPPSAWAPLRFTGHLPSSFPSQWPGEGHGLCMEYSCAGQAPGRFWPLSQQNYAKVRREREGGRRQSHSLAEKALEM